MITLATWATFTALMCAETQLINKSDEPFTNTEKEVLQQVIDAKPCEKKFPKSNPCLVSITKIGPGRFHATCGPKKEN